MTSTFRLCILTGALLLAATPPAVAAAQEIVASPTPNADALAAQMRILAASPRDVTALITAADLSTRLADPAAALGFLIRAQAIDPSNPRITAARANAFVASERPGEALRLFVEAEGRGVSMTPYLSQRGLAYDLTGQTGYAQRDYRRALLTGSDDETIRRLALSLGISGQRDEALTLLDPLVRRNDRAAWRARACVLALSGDVAGAQAIATGMMAGGAAFAPFFARLPALSIADRAFAVHFGGIGGTAARMADARMAPPVQPLVPERPAPVVVAAAAPTTTPAKERGRRIRPGRQPIDVSMAPTSAFPVRSARPNVSLAASTPTRAPVVARGRPTVTARARSAPAAQDWTAALAPLSVPQPVPVEVTTASPVVPTPTVSPPPVSPPAPVVSTVKQPATALVTTATPSPATPLMLRSAPSATVPVRIVSVVPKPIRSPETARRNTALLASIIETIDVPQSELAATVRSGTRKPAVAATAKPAAIVTKAEAKKPEPKKPEPKKAEPKKPEPKKPDPVKAEPERWWVQVAGGANEADLGKEWKKVAAKAPTALRGRTAWTTPQRATNRLLAGPFKTQAEAMALVNGLRKDGVSTFAWQSDAGQKVAKLPTR